MTHDLNDQQPCGAGDGWIAAYGHELVSDGGTRVEDGIAEPPIDPTTRALIHAYRGVGLHQEQIAEWLNVSQTFVYRTLKDTRGRVEDGADPLDVFADVMEPAALVDPPEVDDD